MSERATVIAELVCIVVIAVGVWFIDWRLALIVGGGLTLLGLQGIGQTQDSEAGE